MAEFIEILSPSALKDLQTANLEVVKLVASIDKVGQNMAKITTPSGSDNATKKLVQDYQNLQKQLQNTQQQLEKNRVAEIKLQQARERAMDKYEAQLTREQAKLNASSNLYNKVQAKLNVLSNEYKALATRQELGIQLTDKEAQRYTFLQGKIQAYDKTLKAVDATMGKYQRNVGNYAGAFNPLSNSINQLTREMPAFTYSVQTGFMALSNNIPIFTDAIGNAIKQNKELAAQGQPTTSVLKQLAGAFLSWGTALSVGITLLTVFGKEIGEFISGSESKKKALEAETKAIENKNKVEEQARESLARYQSDEISKSKILLENAKNITLSMEIRTKAVTELQQRYPEYLGSLSKEQILAGDTADAEMRLNDALVKRGIALASQQAIQDEINNGLKNEKWLADQLTDIQNKRIALGEKISKIDPFTRDEEQKDRYEELNKQLTRLFYLEGTLKEQYQGKNKTIKDSIKFYIDQYNANAKYLDIVKEEGKATKENTKAKRIDIEAIKMQKENVFGLIEKLKALKSALEKQRDEQSLSRDEFEKFTKTIDAVQRSIDGLTTGYKDLGESGLKSTNEFLRIYSNQAQQATVDTEALKKATDDFINSFSEGFLADAGLGSLQMFFDGTFDKLMKGAETMEEKFAVAFLAISQVAEEAFAFIDQASQQNFDRQYQRLEQDRDVAMMFAGDSASAREEIEEQYERKRVAIQKRQAQAEKRSAIFKTIINTAQAIVATLAQTPPPAGIPLAVAMGAVGAAQVAIIAAQQIPQFWTGTDNAPEGMAWTQEKGREIITDKSGKIKSLGSDKGAQMTYLNKGDKVFNANETEALMFNSSLNNMLLGNNIVIPKVEVSMDTSILGTKIDNLTNVISNKPSYTVVKDARGERIYERKQAETRELLNSRLNIKTYNV